MARSIERDSFTDDDYAAFTSRVQRQVEALWLLLLRHGFGEGPPTLGAECELDIIGADARPLSVNRQLLARALDARCSVELDRFNLEVNCTPVPAAGRPFSAMRDEITQLLGRLGDAAAPLGGRIVAVGILPTLMPDDLTREALTDLPRYRALSNGLRRWRQAPFHVRLAGEDPLDITCDDITLEGANTSFQLHLRVPPREFARTYDAAQLVTPLAVAIGANSPLFVGHRLWDETRVALFKQALDHRDEDAARRRLPSRVSFGYGWNRQGAWELFAESAALYPPILPQLAEEEDAMAVVRAGGVPRLAELRLHQGTVWRWNRAIYDPGGGGHLRIEMRALPAGPTPIDMAASAAFLAGLVMAFRTRVDAMRPGLPFVYAEQNFYRAAQHGLDASLLWPVPSAPSPRLVGVRELLAQHLDDAAAGLAELGVERLESDEMLEVIRARLKTGRTGARWQRQTLAALVGGRAPTPQAVGELVEAYVERAKTGRPVHEWD